MRTTSKSSLWAAVLVLSGAAALASACGGSGSDNRGSAGSSSSTAGSSSSSGGSGASTSTGGSGATTSTGGAGGTTASTCDGSKMCCPTVSCPCPFPAGDGSNDAIANADDGKATFTTAGVTKAAGHWDFSHDSSSGTVTPGMNPPMPVAGGANGTMDAMHVTGMNLTGWGAALAAEVANGCPFDASKYGGITFWAKGTSTVAEGANKLLVLVGMPEFLPKPQGFCDGAATNPADPNCYARHRVVIDLTADWKQYTIAWTDLQPPGYLSVTQDFNPNRITDIVFNASGPAPMTTPAATFDFWIDQLAFVAPGTPSTIGSGSGGSGAGGASSGGSGGAATSGGSGGAAAGTGGAAAGNGGAGG